MLLVGAAAIAATVAVALLSPAPGQGAPEQVLPKRTEGGYVSSDACRSCHPAQHASWRATYHRTMTQALGPGTVLAPFESQRFQNYGQTGSVERKGDEYWLEFDGGGGAGKREQGSQRGTVVMTTGSHHFQVYWIRGDKGRELIQFPWRYYMVDGRWMHRRDVFLMPLGRALHRDERVWNGNCFPCHQVGMAPGRNNETGIYDKTRVAELGIACEACHGPGAAHVAKNQNPLTRYKSHLGSGGDPSIVNPAKLNARRSSEVCGQCHGHLVLDSAQMISGATFRPGDALRQHARMRRHTPGRPSGRFWGDGSSKSGGREYNAMERSACYRTGKLSCLTCHSMHDSNPDDQLSEGMDGNAACTQCHKSYAAKLKAHTHHEPGSSGSQCQNCHMAHTAYALLKGIRNHQIDSPTVVGVVPEGRPNACNLCHLDKSLAWTADTMERWYDRKAVRPLDADEKTTSAALLWLLRGDASQRVIVSWHMRWPPALAVSGRDWQAPHLARLLEDPYPAVRYVAGASLAKLPGFAGMHHPYADPPDKRASARAALIKRWMARGGAADRVGDAVLIDAPRSLRASEVDSVLQRRDDRRVGIVE